MLVPADKKIDCITIKRTRRTSTRLGQLGRGELDQIQFLLANVSIQTAERCLGWKQEPGFAVNGNRHRTVMARDGLPLPS
jgi:hypothetical protein